MRHPRHAALGTTRAAARCLGALAACLVALATQAAPLYVAGVGCDGPFVSVPDAATAHKDCDVQLPSAFLPDPGDTWSRAQATAGPGAINLLALSEVHAPDVTSRRDMVVTQATGEWFFDDFVIVGTGSQSTPVLAALNLQIHGILFGGLNSDRTGSLQTSAATNTQFFFQIDLNGTQAGFGEVIRRNRDGVVSLTEDGLLTGRTSGDDNDTLDNAVITSSQLLLPVGTAFVVHVYTNAGATASGLVSGSPADENDRTGLNALAVSDFSATIRFPTTGPVFLLPPGYTVFSASAGIVDNAVINPTPASEPSSLALGALALLLVAQRRLARAPPG